MADDNNRSTQYDDFKEAVCIDAGRVYDSCCDRDCLEDLRVYFTEDAQAIVSSAIGIKIKSAEVADVTIDVEPVGFNRGFFSCDLNFFFLVTLDVTTTAGSCPTEVRGVALFNKKAILYGCDGNVRTFSNCMCSENPVDACGLRVSSSPKCVVQAVDPVALSASLADPNGTFDNIGSIPAWIIEYLGGPVVTTGTPTAFVSLGLFTIVQLIRRVQMLVPVYDFCIPEKHCDCTTDQPCDVFRKIDFPTDDFFPTCAIPKSGGCGC